MRIRIFARALLLTAAPAILSAQSPGSSVSAGRDLALAMRLGYAGQTAAARAIVDSLMNAARPDDSIFPSLLFARATLAVSALDAGLDYQRIINELPSAELRKESLLRIAQRALITGEAAKALDYLGTRSREYADDASLAEANYWKARVLLDSHDVKGACDALGEAKAQARSSAGITLSDIAALSTLSCAALPAAVIRVADSSSVKAVTPPPKVKTETGSVSRVFAVQVSAFDRRAVADQFVERLRKKGLDAHVDGTVRPFRVRIGRYATFAEAAKNMRELKGRGISGFVAEMTP